MNYASFETVGTQTFQQLFASDYPHLLVKKTLASGENLTMGAVCGVVTADGKIKLADETETDGSQTADLILAVDTDATSGDQETFFIRAGHVRSEQLSFGGSLDVAAVTAVFRTKGIFID